MAFNTYPYSPFPASTEQLHKGDNEDLQAQIDAIKDGTTIDSFGDVETALATKTDNAVIAPEFDAEAGIYSVGDLVMYEGKLYEFTTAHETAGDWNSEEVTEKTIADEVDTLKSGLTDLENGAKTLLGKLEVSESVQLPATWKRIYILVNISDYFNGTINEISGSHIVIPFSVGSWASTINIEISGSTVTFASETTISGTKDSGWNTYAEIYYS